MHENENQNFYDSHRPALINDFLGTPAAAFAKNKRDSKACSIS